MNRSAGAGRRLRAVTYEGAICSSPGDINLDGIVDAADLAIVLGNWGPCPDPPDPCIADLNGDGIVGPADLAIVLGNWG